VDNKPTIPPRNDCIELLRYICAVGIVWFHLGGPFAWVGYSALLVFVMLSIFFSMNQTGSAWHKTRVLKLWLFWSAVYAALKFAQSLYADQPVLSEFHWWMLFTGPALPLWFLPFIYVANGVAHWYKNLEGGWYEVTALPLLAMLCAYLVPHFPMAPVAQWLMGATGVFMGIALFRGRHQPRFIFVMLAALLGAVLTDVADNSRMLLLAFVVAAACLYRAPLWSSMLAKHLGAISLGVYVLHHGVSAALKPAHFPIVLQIGSVVLASTLLALIAKRMPIFSRFV